MTKGFLRQTAPFVVPTTDGKTIEEHYGVPSSGDAGFSVAHMIAPPGWSEPAQQPAFDEVTIVVRGRKKVEVDGTEMVLGPGESVLVRRGARVRYSNPFAEETEYWAVCVPAFTLDKANRE